MMVDNLSRIERLEKIQAQAVEKAGKEGITAHTKLTPGGKVLGETLVKTADELKVDLIVIGSNNRGAIGEFMFGSVSKHVLRYAACPVLVVK
jgi:nucleotide-binding universal stress UspA family protein